MSPSAIEVDDDVGAPATLAPPHSDLVANATLGNATLGDMGEDDLMSENLEDTKPELVNQTVGSFFESLSAPGNVVDVHAGSAPGGGGEDTVLMLVGKWGPLAFSLLTVLLIGLMAFLLRRIARRLSKMEKHQGEFTLPFQHAFSLHVGFLEFFAAHRTYREFSYLHFTEYIKKHRVTFVSLLAERHSAA